MYVNPNSSLIRVLFAPYWQIKMLLNSFNESVFFLIFVCSVFYCLFFCLFVHLLLVTFDNLHVTVQKRSLRWPQDLDGTMRFVELYVVNDFSQVGWMDAI